ncbi:MAG: hypothetical protein MJZ82_02305 [Paludibacteraceae bacterium]|nr:hypothetical protein [Paludibacteraceae bacterium]
MKKIFSIALMALCAIATVNAQTTPQGTVTVSDVLCGQSVEITATPAAGYHFVNWTDDDNSNNVISTSTTYTIEDIHANFNYTANFALNQITVTIKLDTDADGIYDVTLTNAADFVTYMVNATADPDASNADNINLVATEDDGSCYHFDRWTLADGATDADNTLVSTNKTATAAVTGDQGFVAYFTINKYTVHVHTAGNVTTEGSVDAVVKTTNN